MGERWIAHGPDDFGDFSISAEGEQLAKCVVVQNGFRTPEETKAISERLIKAVNNHEALVSALREIGLACDGPLSYSRSHLADKVAGIARDALLGINGPVGRPVQGE